MDIDENTPARHAECGRQWRAAGTTIIGGC